MFYKICQWAICHVIVLQGSPARRGLANPSVQKKSRRFGGTNSQAVFSAISNSKLRLKLKFLVFITPASS